MKTDKTYKYTIEQSLRQSISVSCLDILENTWSYRGAKWDLIKWFNPAMFVHVPCQDLDFQDLMSWSFLYSAGDGEMLLILVELLTTTVYH